MKKKKISWDSLVCQVEDIVASDIDGETVMISVENGKYYGLDAIGSNVWKMIAEPVRVSNLIDALVEKYEVDRKTCQNDVVAFLNTLNDDGILQVR